MNDYLEIRPLQESDLQAAVDMAWENYVREKKNNSALQELERNNFLYREIERLIQLGIGCIAIKDGKPVGFLCFGELFDINDNGGKGATSPLWGYGICGSNRGEIIGKLFQAVAAMSCERYAESLRVSVYAHDLEVLKMYIMSSFAMDVTDVIRGTEEEVAINSAELITFKELTKAELLAYKEEVLNLYRELINHLRQSPVFYHCSYFLPIEKRFDDFISDDMRIFAAFDKDKFIGMIDSEPSDVTFAIGDRESTGMGDVFVNTAYRGKGIAAELLNFAIGRLRESGIKRIYVTHGTINPTARGFWDKYFSNYSYTMTREIDPDMLGVIERV